VRTDQPRPVQEIIQTVFDGGAFARVDVLGIGAEPARLEAHAPGLTPRAVLETLSGILMLEVHLPLADGRELVLPRYTQPEPEHRLLLEKLGWELPAQPPPRIRSPKVTLTPNEKETKSKM
jgi:hypothetical protein